MQNEQINISVAKSGFIIEHICGENKELHAAGTIEKMMRIIRRLVIVSKEKSESSTKSSPSDFKKSKKIKL